MPRFRYRSPVVLGRWFATREEALADALRAGQAYRDVDDETRVKLRDDTFIEESDEPLPVRR
jgi:hypothetical protein